MRLMLPSTRIWRCCTAGSADTRKVALSSKRRWPWTRPIRKQLRVCGKSPETAVFAWDRAGPEPSKARAVVFFDLQSPGSLWFGALTIGVGHHSQFDFELFIRIELAQH